MWNLGVVKKWFQEKYPHILVWGIYVFWEIIVALFVADRKPTFLGLSGHYGVIIFLFYFNATSLTPYFKRNMGPILCWIPITLIFIGLYISLHYVVDIFITTVDVSQKKFFFGFTKRYFLTMAYRGFFFYGASLGYYYLMTTRTQEKKMFENELERETLDKKLMVANNLYLKAQINPHFLFNVLHFINYRLKPGSEESEALLHLSNIMHFAFSSDEGGETIRIGDELTHVEELIALQELRGSRFEGLDLRYDLVVCELRIIPLVLLTLVENVYKHGDLSNGQAFLSLEADEDSECLVVRTFNKIGGKQLISDRTGMGNIAKRLTNAYGNEADFSYRKIDDHFEVLLKLPFKLLQR